MPGELLDHSSAQQVQEQTFCIFSLSDKRGIGRIESDLNGTLF